MKTLKDLEQAAETNSWWKEMLDEVYRAYHVHIGEKHLPPEQKSDLVRIILELSLVSEEMLKQAQTDAVFIEARKILEDLSIGQTFPERLIELYKLRKEQALERIEQYSKNLMKLISGRARQKEAERVWATQRSDLASLLNDHLTKTHELSQRYILRSILELAHLADIIQHDTSFPLGNGPYNPVASEIGGRDRRDYLAYCVADPLWEHCMEQFEPEYVSFPLRWVGTIPILKVKKLYEHHKAGGDVLAEFVSYYQEEDRLSNLTAKITDCPVTSTYGELFKETAQSFQLSIFKVCSIPLLAMIEGILWEFAWWWNKAHGPIFGSPITRSQYKKGKFKLLRRDGTPIGAQPTIGTLLRETTLGDAVYIESIEYFCQELFTERNPVLHGRKPEYGDAKKAATLLFVVENIIEEITKAAKAGLTDNILEALRNGSTANVDTGE